MKKVLGLMVLLLLSVLAGCSTVDTDDEGAEKLINSYMQAVQAGDYEKAFSMVHPDFFGVRSREEWLARFAEVNEKLGKLEKLKLKRKLSDARFSGHFYIYQFANKYEKGLAKEMVTIVQKINSDEPLRISGHKIESSKLQ